MAPQTSAPEADSEAVVRRYATAMTPEPRVALLGSPRYGVLVTNAGAGYSRAEGIAVTRWRADATRDDTGQWLYLADVATGRVWSATHQPTTVEADAYDVTFATDRAVFDRRDGEIETRLEIVAIPRDRAEVRTITITNRSGERRDIEVTSYGEIVLTDPKADRAHPAFENLFVETEWVASCATLLASRRPRDVTDAPQWCAHIVATGPERIGEPSFETDRDKFIGRGRSPRCPRALDHDQALGGSIGAVLDPIVSIRVRLRIEPGRSAQAAFTTLVGDARSGAIDCAGRYGELGATGRATARAGTEALVELRDRNIAPADAATFQQIAGALLFPSDDLRSSAHERAMNRGGQQTLWAHGISGDWPILLATVDCDAGFETLRELLKAHEYWRTKGFTTDLVILAISPASNGQHFEDRLLTIVTSSAERCDIDKPGGVFIRRRDVIGDDGVLMLRATARVTIECDGADLKSCALLLHTPNDQPPAAAASRDVTDAAPRLSTPAPASGNGFGNVAADGAYEIHVNGETVPPAPWINVIANPQAGFCVTERGGGFSWVENSFFFRLTPWHNDPVSDPLGDVLYLQEHDGDALGAPWTPTPGPSDEALGEYLVRHAPGRTTFTHAHDGIVSELALGVPVDDPVKIARLRLTNRSARPRRVRLTSYVEWTLGEQRERTRDQIHTWHDPATGAVFASNFFAEDFSNRVAFSWVSEPLVGFTASREEFIGRNGSLVAPAGLGVSRLSESTGAGVDPCAALRAMVTLAPGETRDVVVLLGAATSEVGARDLIERNGAVARATAALDGAVDAWKRRLSTMVVHTPAPEFDAMANGWSLYQALSCRMWGRSAFYQSGGAYGFRDQLQDCMAFVYAEPAVARAHLVRAAGRQFREGDVQHWWHVPSGRGVRTRSSDDLVWLAFAADHYVRVTGDAAVFDERIAFLDQPPLAPGEKDAYALPTVSDDSDTLFVHCVRALDRACTTGAHGLPLIGDGDWNDGFNRVGVNGRGESVWLAWFLILTLRRTADHADGRHEAATAERLRKRADEYAAAVDREAWDGAWYRRAFFDDGTPLGSATSDECQIDAIAQSWSVISGAGDPERARRAMQSVNERLVDGDARVIKLLTPPFDRMTHDPGYIKGYVPGVRENGAQYTHAALWTVLATALLGDGDRAFTQFEMLNPLSHSRTAGDVARYKVEPYALCADVYTAQDHIGRGGWTWYTGSAGWSYRVAIETILGFTKRGTRLTIDPRVPRAWPEFRIDYRYMNTTYLITVRNPCGVCSGVTHVEVDGRQVATGTIDLVDDAQPHRVIVTMGSMGSP
jgi:cyclic beta-1,2-glucan synthetase